MKIKTQKNGYWRKIAVAACILTSSLLLSFCGGAKTSNVNAESGSVSAQGDGKQVLDTLMDKYCGLYISGESTSRPEYISIGKFPENSRIHLTGLTEGGKYIPEKYVAIEKAMVGKYFYVEKPLYFNTKNIQDYAGGYVAPEQGDLLLGVDKSGEIHNQNFDHATATGRNDNPLFHLGGSGTYGKFVKRADGKYNIFLNNATYEFKKGI